MIIFHSKSAADTIKIGAQIARKLKKGDVVALSGELGAGKTTLVKGVAKGLGVKRAERVSSPTFALIHEYQGKFPVFHLDWYRMDQITGVDAALADECFYGGGVTLVEWPERGKKVLPKKFYKVKIEHQKESHRKITFR